MINMIVVFILRYFLCWLIVAVMTLCAVTCMIGHQKGLPAAKWRQKAVYNILAPMFRMLMFFIGVTWMKKEKKTDVDY